MNKTSTLILKTLHVSFCSHLISPNLNTQVISYCQKKQEDTVAKVGSDTNGEKDTLDTEEESTIAAIPQTIYSQLSSEDFC